MIEQRSEAWFIARCGSLGASQVPDALAKIKTGWGASRANVAAQLVAERLTGKPTEGFTTPAMLRGIELEPEARSAYAFRHDCDVAEIDLIRHPLIAGSHASPDGLIGDVGLVEIKCCGAARHIELLRGAEPEGRHTTQCRWQLACTSLQWVDLAYYNPDLPERMRLHVTRIHRDDVLIKSLEQDVSDFLAEVDETVAQLRARYEREAA